MNSRRIKTYRIVLASLLSLVVVGPVHAADLGSIGIYIYENLESYHAVSSTTGNVLVAALVPHAEKAMAFDKVPLQSNETVRILSDMTEGREVVVSALVTWLGGAGLAVPTVKMADDEIKFKDLTWHIDHDAVVADARERGLDQVLIGSATGQLRATQESAATSGSRLISVTIQANFQLIDLDSGSAVWAKAIRHVQAGFDPRVAFDEGLMAVGEKAAEALTAQFDEK